MDSPAAVICGVRTHIDETDRHILALLQQDGRITNAEIAKRVGLPPPSALQRVRQLEKAGLIKGYTAVLDPEKLGLRITVMAMITLALHQEQAIERFRRSILDMPEVVECYHVSGQYDYVLKILVKDIRAYEILVREKLARIKGIQQITSSIVFAVPKHTTQIPL